MPELHADGTRPVYDFGDPFEGGGDVSAANGAATTWRSGTTTTMDGPGWQLGERFSNRVQARGFKTDAAATAYDAFMRTGKELFGDKFIQQAIRGGDLLGGPADLAVGLVGGGKSGQQAIRASEDAAYLVERTFIGGAREAGPLRELEVGRFKELHSIRRTFGTAGAYDIDHIPSKAALRIAREDELGRTLTAAEIRQIENEGIGVTIERQMHIRMMRTVLVHAHLSFAIGLEPHADWMYGAYLNQRPDGPGSADYVDPEIDALTRLAVGVGRGDLASSHKLTQTSSASSLRCSTYCRQGNLMVNA